MEISSEKKIMIKRIEKLKKVGSEKLLSNEQLTIEINRRWGGYIS